MLGDRLIQLNEYVSFHTPGHSGGIVDFPPFNAPIAWTDTTETPFTDDLKAPETIIAEAEAAVGKIYGTAPVIFSTAGATALIQTAIYRNRRERFLVYEAAHSSVYNALRLTGAAAYQSVGIPVEAAVKQCKATAVIVTSPDYYGRTVSRDDIERLGKKVKVIVDASHGAHFAFSDKLPVSATEYADTVIHSMHKTLPVLTGGAVLHVPENEYDDYMAAFRLFHTTSPSYPVMASIEAAAKYFSENGKRLYDKVYSDVAAFKRVACAAGYRTADNDDFSRVVIVAPGGGKALNDILLKNKIVPEFRSDNDVTLIVTPYNSDRLKDVGKVLTANPYRGDVGAAGIEAPKGVFGLEFADLGEVVPIAESRGRRAFGGIGEYPPGTPRIFPGQVIGDAEYEYLTKLSQSGGSFGLDKDGVSVIK